MAGELVQFQVPHLFCKTCEAHLAKESDIFERGLIKTNEVQCQFIGLNKMENVYESLFPYTDERPDHMKVQISCKRCSVLLGHTFFGLPRKFGLKLHIVFTDSVLIRDGIQVKEAYSEVLIDNWRRTLTELDARGGKCVCSCNVDLAYTESLEEKTIRTAIFSADDVHNCHMGEFVDPSEDLRAVLYCSNCYKKLGEYDGNANKIALDVGSYRVQSPPML